MGVSVTRLSPLRLGIKLEYRVFHTDGVPILEDFVAHCFEDIDGLFVVIQRIGDEDKIDLILILRNNTVECTRRGCGRLQAAQGSIEVKDRFDRGKPAPADKCG